MCAGFAYGPMPVMVVCVPAARRATVGVVWRGKNSGFDKLEVGVQLIFGVGLQTILADIPHLYSVSSIFLIKVVDDDDPLCDVMSALHVRRPSTNLGLRVLVAIRSPCLITDVLKVGGHGLEISCEHRPPCPRVVSELPEEFNTFVDNDFKCCHASSLWSRLGPYTLQQSQRLLGFC